MQNQQLSTFDIILTSSIFYKNSFVIHKREVSGKFKRL